MRDRAAAFLLSSGIVALLLLLMLRMGAFQPQATAPGARLVAVKLSGDRNRDARKADQPRRQEAAQPDRATTAIETPARVVPPPAVEVPVPSWLQMSRESYAATDISRIARSPGSAAAAASGGGAGQGSGTEEGAGEGPGGARLYNAEWYRKPSRAELAGFLPPAREPGAWAMIACRTVEKFHVEDCQELDESPRGSGLARGLRRSAWQFLVRPPRVNGKPMIGTWVRIRFDFTLEGDGADASSR